MRFNVFLTVSVYVLIWTFKPWNCGGINQRFEGTCCFHLQGRRQ